MKVNFVEKTIMLSAIVNKFYQDNMLSAKGANFVKITCCQQ
jgi:hypothetical protein